MYTVEALEQTCNRQKKHLGQWTGSCRVNVKTTNAIPLLHACLWKVGRSLAQSIRAYSANPGVVSSNSAHSSLPSVGPCSSPWFLSNKTETWPNISFKKMSLESRSTQKNPVKLLREPFVEALSTVTLYLKLEQTLCIVHHQVPHFVQHFSRYLLRYRIWFFSSFLSKQTGFFTSYITYMTFYMIFCMALI